MSATTYRQVGNEKVLNLSQTRYRCLYGSATNWKPVTDKFQTFYWSKLLGDFVSDKIEVTEFGLDRTMLLKVPNRPGKYLLPIPDLTSSTICLHSHTPFASAGLFPATPLSDSQDQVDKNVNSGTRSTHCKRNYIARNTHAQLSRRNVRGGGVRVTSSDIYCRSPNGCRRKRTK